MSKQIRMMAAVLVMSSAACATAPETRAPDGRPDEPEPIRVEEPRGEDPWRVGVILSSSGSAVMKQYGDMVLAGAQVAERSLGTRRAVELVVRDDGGTATGAVRAVQELEQAGVDVIVGPLVDDALIAAARARSSDDLVLISPTAVSQPVGVRNVYALNVVDTRGSTALGEYARRWQRVGVLHSRSPDSEHQARAFQEAYGGHAIVAAYPRGTTNIGAQLAMLRDSAVQAVYIPTSEQELPLVLPQLEYSLTGVQLLGNESWLSDAARRAPPRVLEGAIVATPLLRESNAVAWQDFVEGYENLHRRTLSNPVPALGYDAAALALNALTTGRSTITDFRGATGVITLRNGSVTRRPFLARIAGGSLVPLD